jgi:ribosomal protein L29
MKINDLRKMSSKDLRAKLLENSESLQKYRFQKSIQQLEDYKVINDVKNENAKILTILSQLDDMEESNG